jgi:hypothetical protein
MHGLPLQDGAAPKIPNFARDVCEMLFFATHATGARRKTRSANPNNVKRQLCDLETGANTLLRRMKNAAPNVFLAWKKEADLANYGNHHEVTYEWLQLKRLLEKAAERSKRAAQAPVLKAEAPENRGRHSDYIAALTTVAAANAYEELTGRSAVRCIDRDKGKSYGEFHEFLTAVFRALGIDSSPDAANMQFQAALRHLRKPKGQ